MASGAGIGSAPDLGHLAAELVHGDEAALDHRLGGGLDPAFVIAHPVVSVGAQPLDVASHLIHGHESFFEEERQDRVHPLFPKRVVVLARLNRAGRQPAHVVMRSPRVEWDVRLGHLASRLSQRNPGANLRRERMPLQPGADRALNEPISGLAHQYPSTAAYAGAWEIVALAAVPRASARATRRTKTIRTVAFLPAAARSVGDFPKR